PGTGEVRPISKEAATLFRQIALPDNMRKLNLTTFSIFKQSAAADIFGRLGVDISGCVDWEDYTSLISETNRQSRDQGPENCFVERAIRFSEVLSTAERLVLKAALTAADFAHAAEEIECSFWRDMNCLDSKNRRAIAAVLIREGA
ncbi:MAG: hypothetical protein ABJO06_14645, partial [Roseibium sp.]